jgi:hypothetical protein
MNVSIERIVWTPAGSEMGLGTVIMERPTEPLTMEQYRGYLAGRVTRMVRRAGLERASKLLSQTAELVEGLSARDPLETSDLMVWDSEELANKSGMLDQDWPIPPGQIKPDPDLTVEQVEETDLEEWLGLLYPGV